MRDLQERNRRIRQMRASGASEKDIAVAISMSVAAVRSVLRKSEADAAAFRRSEVLLQKFRETDDLDRRWRVTVMLDAFLLMTTTRTALKWWFHWNDTERISLRELMDLVIADRDHAKPGHLITPLLDMRCVGVKGFWSAVRRLTESDLGQTCNEEWQRRLARLRQSTRIVGVRHTWSKPCEHPTRLSSADQENSLPARA